MAKPIIVVTADINSIRSNFVKDAIAAIKKSLDYEYHVLFNLIPNATFKMECFNDCKGLLDVDIEQLIKDYTNGTTTRD